jgi:hypothetical protein
MCVRVKSETPGPAHFVIGTIHILEKLAFILKNACILKSCATLQSGNITAEQACATSWQAANKHVFDISEMFRAACHAIAALGKPGFTN